MLPVWLLKTLMHLSCLGYGGWIFYLAASDQLGADPAKALLHSYGTSAVHCLFITLLLAPLSRALRQPLWLRCRRLMGLYSFAYGTAHLLCFMAFEWLWQWRDIALEIAKRPYLTLGFAAWLIGLALALTSFRRLQRRMGKRWGQLHQLVYPMLLFAVIHQYWSQKSASSPELFYLLAALALLWLQRKPRWRSS